MSSEESAREQNQEEQTTVAALDLGSNSFHMAIAVQSHGELRIMETHGEKVRLAGGIDERGRINDEAMTRAMACLERFRQRIRHFDADRVQIVGTNALRVAKNRRQFIQQAQDIVGFPVEVISGHEEARLIYLGVAHSMADDEGRRLVIDIGGGSTEFIIGERFEPNLLESLHMGCVSYRDRYFSEGLISKSKLDKAVLEASRELLNIKAHYQGTGWQNAVGSSGSIKAVSYALKHCGISDGVITLDALKALRKLILKYKSANELTELGVKVDRCTTFCAGFAILYAVFKNLDVDEMYYNSGALREGLLYDILGRNTHEDVRNRTIQSLQQRFSLDLEQSARVEATALHAYEQIAKAWNMRSSENESLLRWACQLYEIGRVISHSQYHKHGSYLILHSDLPGFTNPMQVSLANLIRLHRRRIAQEVLDEMEQADRNTLLKLAIILRLAIILTANRVSQETDFEIETMGEDSVTINMGDKWISEHPLTVTSLLEEKDRLGKVKIDLMIR